MSSESEIACLGHAVSQQRHFTHLAGVWMMPMVLPPSSSNFTKAPVGQKTVHSLHDWQCEVSSVTWPQSLVFTVCSEGSPSELSVRSKRPRRLGTC